MNISSIVSEVHPNISRTLACGLDIRSKENPAFIVSEWIDEGDLGQFVKNSKI
jgi:serine/threonine protein kinase